MEIISSYREVRKILLETEMDITKFDDGSLRLSNRYMWSGNAKHYYVEVPVWELLKLREACNQQLGDLAGVKLITSIQLI